MTPTPGPEVYDGPVDDDDEWETDRMFPPVDLSAPRTRAPAQAALLPPEPPPPVVEPATAPAALPPCARCGEPTLVLLSLPGESRRTVCGGCQGRANRQIADGLAEAIRTLKHSDDPEEERRAIALLRQHDPHQADQTVAAIARAREDGKYSKRGER